MAPERFDGHIKSKIYHLETDVPDQLWAQIDQKLRPEKRNRGFVWFLLGVLFLLSAGLITHLARSNKDPNTKFAGPILSEVEANQDESSIEVVGQIPAVAHDGAETVHSSLLGAIQETDVQLEEITQSHVSNLAVEKSNPTLNPTIPERQSSNRARSEELLALSAARDLAQEAITTLKKIDGEITHNSGTPLNASESPRQEDQPLPFAGRASVQLSPLHSKLFTVSSDLKDPLTSNCPSFRAKTLLRPFAELTLGGGIPIRHLTSLNPEGSDYKNLRDRTEKIRGVYGARLMVGADIGAHFEAKVGVSFTQINEVFDYIDENSSRTVVNTVTDTIRDTDGNITDIRYDTSIVTEYGQRIKLANNYYRFLDIPAMVGYRFKVKNHSFILQAGASLNLAFWKEADLLAPDESIVNVDSGNSSPYPVFKTKAGVDLLGGIGYSLDITERNTLRVLASVQYPLSPLTLTEYPLEQKYTQIKLGLSWKHYLW